MQKYAVVKITGKQYKVCENQQVLVDKLQDAKKIDYKVLLVSDEKGLVLGKPYIDKAKVVFEVVSPEEKGEKIDVFKYKSKSRYRKHIGFRPRFTRLLVKNITSN